MTTFKHFPARRGQAWPLVGSEPSLARPRSALSLAPKVRTRYTPVAKVWPRPPGDCRRGVDADRCGPSGNRAQPADRVSRATAPRQGRGRRALRPLLWSPGGSPCRVRRRAGVAVSAGSAVSAVEASGAGQPAGAAGLSTARSHRRGGYDPLESSRDSGHRRPLCGRWGGGQRPRPGVGLHAGGSCRRAPRSPRAGRRGRVAAVRAPTRWPLDDSELAVATSSVVRS